MTSCELCKIIKDKKKYKIYFETEEAIILEKNDNLVLAIAKEHKENMPDNRIGVLIKLSMKMLGRNKPDHNYIFKQIDDCEGHFGIYITVKG